MLTSQDISGPVIPVPVPFNEDESIDHGSLASYIGFLADSGIKTVMTTVGTSRFNLLNEDEIKQVNETIAGAGEKKLTVIAANPQFGSTVKCLEFAEHAKSAGADAFQAFFPERFYSDDYIYDFFTTVHDAVDIPIIIHEMPMRNGLGGGTAHYSLDLLDRLTDLPRVIGIKEESLDPGYSQKILKRVGHKVAIIGAGGGMSRFLKDYWLGARSYLGGIGNFNPALELEFFGAMMSGDFKRAHEIVYNIEIPYFESVVPLGWHPSLKAALFLKGHMKPCDRKPFKTLTGEEEKTLKKIMQDLGI